MRKIDTWCSPFCCHAYIYAKTPIAMIFTITPIDISFISNHCGECETDFYKRATQVMARRRAPEGVVRA